MDVIDWVVVYLTSQYGVPNFIRFSKEVEQPSHAVNTSVPAAAVNRHVSVNGENIQVTIEVPSVSTSPVGATAPVSPTDEKADDSV